MKARDRYILIEDRSRQVFVLSKPKPNPVDSLNLRISPHNANIECESMMC